MKIAILSSSDYRSPKLLANSLRIVLENNSQDCDLIYSVDTIKRLVAYKYKRKSIRFHYWFSNRLKHFINDFIILRKLKKYDLIVLCECIPNAFLRNVYNIERFKTIVKKPVCLYEVYYLGNAPSQIKRLNENNDPTFNRFDFHLSASDITEIKSDPKPPWFNIGLNLSVFDLKPSRRDSFVALIDFEQEGYSHYRSLQIEVLKELGIPFIELSGDYTFEEIRMVYKSTAIYFMQISESFGVPIAECLAYGNLIFTQEESWPMAWRIEGDEEYNLASCFVVYKTKEMLKLKLQDLMAEYDLEKTPFEVNDVFMKKYSSYYKGNVESTKDFITNAKAKSLI